MLKLLAQPLDTRKGQLHTPAAMTFEAKVDLWFLAVFYGAGVAMLASALFFGRKLRRRIDAPILFVIGALFVGVGWRTSAVQYVLTTDGFLDSTGWPFDGRITPIRSIRSVEPSRDGRASHAASFDRLRIDYGRHGVIFIAVHDKARFLDALAAQDTGLERTATGVRRIEAETDQDQAL